TAETDPIFLASDAAEITCVASSYRDDAYRWGDHASAGYYSASNRSNYVDACGAVSAIKGDADWNASDWDTAYGWGDHSAAGYLESADIGVTVQGYDQQLADVAGLSYAGNAGKFVAVNGTADGLELVAAGGSGTVTSVGLTVPTGFTVTGSPVTASGTLAISFDTGYVGYTTAEQSKLSGIEANADVTDAANVAAAGAVMDSDFSSNGLMKRTGSGTYTTVADTDVKSIESIIIACSDETAALTTGTAKVTFRMPYAFTLTEVRASVTTAPTGAALQVDINEGGTSILSTKLTIDDGEKTSTTAATPAVISDSALADDAEITIDIDVVGSTIAGAG